MTVFLRADITSLRVARFHRAAGGRLVAHFVGAARLEHVEDAVRVQFAATVPDEVSDLPAWVEQQLADPTRLFAEADS